MLRGMDEDEVKIQTTGHAPGRFILPNSNLNMNVISQGNNYVVGGVGGGGGGYGGGGGGGGAGGPNSTILNQSIGEASINFGGYATVGGGKGRSEHDNKSISSTPSKISKFTYSEYPQVRPTNPLYTSTATIKTAASVASRGSTMNTVSRRQKYNPNQPRRIKDWRWVGALACLLFFPTGIIAVGLAFKAKTKFHDGFIDEAKKLNRRAFTFCIISFIGAMAWILTMFFVVDKWPRTNG